MDLTEGRNMELDDVAQDGAIVPQNEHPLTDGTTARGPGESELQAPTTIWDRLRQIAQKYEQLPCDLPADFAANHDHYIHGTPKRP
jgi:hypothetical protein